MDPKEKENINEEELMSEATQDEAAENEEIQEEDVQDSAAPTEEEKLAQELEEANKVIEEQKDKYLRLSAEFDNYRKRTAKEKESLYGDAKADTVKPFLEVLDNLERGLAQFEEGDPHRQGMEMICKQFMTVLEKLGVQQIEALGQPFDPARHNAVMHVEDESAGENTVVEVFQQGYALGDKILRFAMVKVAN